MKNGNLVSVEKPRLTIESEISSWGKFCDEMSKLNKLLDQAQQETKTIASEVKSEILRHLAR